MPLETKAERMECKMRDAPAVVAPSHTADAAVTRGRGLPPERAAHCIWGLLAILVFAPTLHWLWQRWTMDVRHNVHGLFIPFIVAYFIYKLLRSDPSPGAESSAWGFLFLILGLGMIVLDSGIRTQLLSAFGMVVCLPGLSLLLLGGRRTRALAFVWVLAFFMLPIPAAFMEGFILLLRTITAAGAERVVALFGVPVAREGTVLFLPSANMVIGDGCSGFSVLYASFALALVFAYLNSSWPRRVVTLGLAFPTAVACNVLRCALLGLIVQRWGVGIMETFVHPLSGMLTFTAAAALMTYIGTEMRRSAT